MNQPPPWLMNPYQNTTQCIELRSKRGSNVQQPLRTTICLAAKVLPPFPYGISKNAYVV